MFIKIPNHVEICIEKLKANGFEAFIVGGCVRDAIIEREPNDWDICTSALPMDIKGVFKEYKTIDVGIEHGTVVVILEEENLEITTYRVDGEYKDNRRPEKVEFTSKIKDDLSRRDFTINAMAYNHESGLIDFFQGQEDIKKAIVSCVGNPNKRFNEDALRIMRAFRFAAQLNYKIDKETLIAIENTKKLLGNISVERIVVELNKLIMSEKPESMIKLLFKMNIFKEIIEFIHNYDLKVDKINNYTENCGQIIENSPQDLSVRLTILLNYILNTYEVNKGSLGDDKHSIIENILRELKYDNNTKREVITLNLNYDKKLQWDKIYIKKLLNSIGIDMFKKLILMKSVMDSEFNLKLYEDMLNVIENNKECYKIKDLKVNGRDLINLGIKDGKIVGNMLNTLLEMVIENPSMNNREKLLELAEMLNQFT